MRAGFDGIHHTRIGDARRIALTLQQEFWLIDTAGHVRRQYEQEVDMLGGKRGQGRRQNY